MAHQRAVVARSVPVLHVRHHFFCKNPQESGPLSRMQSVEEFHKLSFSRQAARGSQINEPECAPRIDLLAINSNDDQFGKVVAEAQCSPDRRDEREYQLSVRDVHDWITS